MLRIKRYPIIDKKICYFKKYKQLNMIRLRSAFYGTMLADSLVGI